MWRRVGGFRGFPRGDQCAEMPVVRTARAQVPRVVKREHIEQATGPVLALKQLISLAGSYVLRIFRSRDLQIERRAEDVLMVKVKEFRRLSGASGGE